MRLSSIFTAVVGLALAGASAYMARDFLEAQRAEAALAEQGAIVDVIVASRDIEFGQPIEAHMLTSISWPVDAVPAGVFNTFEELLPAQNGAPRRARRAMSQGEPILVNKVSEFGEKITITQTIGKNNRAMAISVNATTAVGGFVTPGDFVDIVLTQGGGSNLRAITILQNIRIIGVDQNANEQTDAPKVTRTVTVEVTPEQGQTLALAQSAGRLSLTLRTLEAEEDKPLESIKLSDVIQPLSPLPEDQPKPTIRVRRALNVTEEDPTIYGYSGN
ncbi:Flp pilus assembly protein CpaB [Ovoidimarina sediminis]|uniref:Flp pilus assembly protein CpaB n=1 Tax=Ovoidimarina sediminis TaxID=3079856 RepID=UPI002905F91E|nr:Flp pilus assembly protein CpaB [Rhodophyticola sp. MJ-SS7]MDU8946026.1 Flp pilus assembly protein CpaB [Rhodophyticola sp. MJ-SS7]